MAKLVKCKACGREIAKGAKICPGCGKRQKMSFGKRLLIVIVGCCVLAGIGGTINGTSSSSPNVSEKTYKVGEAFKTDKLEITVTSVDKHNSIVDILDAPEGAVFVTVAYKYKNISNSPISNSLFSNGIEIKLIDPNGTEYERDAAASSGFAVEIGADEKVISDLNPGITVKGGDVFEVAKDKLKEKGWKLNVEGEDVTLSF